MKRLITIALLAIGSLAGAQDKVNEISINDLYIPNAPGLILGDKSPAFVDKPVTPRSFAISVLNLGQGGAIEVTPFWLRNKPAYSYEEWVNKNFVLLETFNISVANYKEDENFTYAPGVRMQLWRSFSKSTRKALVSKKDDIVTALGTNKPDEAAIKQLKKELDEISLKGVFVIEVAGAILGSSSGSLFKNVNFNRSGVWTNIRYSHPSFPIGIVGLGRYTWAEAATNNAKDSTFYDVGAALNYATKRFDISAEYVNRRDVFARNNYTRLAVVLNYALTENLYLVASSGKDLKAGNDLLTLFGIKLGLNRNKSTLN